MAADFTISPFTATEIPAPEEQLITLQLVASAPIEVFGSGGGTTPGGSTRPTSGMIYPRGTG